MKTALICGISGQDGAYLASELLDRGYRVCGTSRNAERGDFSNLEMLGIRDRVELVTMAPADISSIERTLSWCNPDEVYWLAAQSSVSMSFSQPIDTLQSIANATLNLLEVIRLHSPRTRIFHASSSECFGSLDGRPANESTPMRPRSPYGVAKACAHLLVTNYREAHGLFATNGILFNHESPLRPEMFVTRKITKAVARIAAGSDEKLLLGNLAIVRDWGWAGEYVTAVHMALQADAPDDFIIATGQSHSLEQFVEAAFDSAGLDWRDYVTVDAALMRRAELQWSGAHPERAERVLGWKAEVDLRQITQRMVAWDRELLVA